MWTIDKNRMAYPRIVLVAVVFLIFVSKLEYGLVDLSKNQMSKRRDYVYKMSRSVNNKK